MNSCLILVEHDRIYLMKKTVLLEHFISLPLYKHPEHTMKPISRLQVNYMNIMLSGGIQIIHNLY